MTQCLFFRTL